MSRPRDISRGPDLLVGAGAHGERAGLIDEELLEREGARGAREVGWGEQRERLTDSTMGEGGGGDGEERAKLQLLAVKRVTGACRGGIEGWS